MYRDSSEVVISPDKQLSIDSIAARISDPEIGKALAELFHFYYFDVHDLSSFASSEYGGKRLDGLMNEIYSCFHHIARGLCEESKTKQEQLDEIQKAENTHLHRLVLDAYKVIIASFIAEYDHVVETLKYFVLIEYLDAFYKDSVNSARIILEKATIAKNAFREAKDAEKRGDYKRTIDFFNKSLQGCYDLRDEIKIFHKSELYNLAHAKYQKEQQDKKVEKKRDRRWQLFLILTSAIFGFFMGLTSDIVKDKIKTLVQTTPLVQQDVHSVR